MSIAATPDDYGRAIESLRKGSPIVREQLLGLVGETTNGSSVFIPGSYRKGYGDALLSANQRPRYSFNLFLIGQLTDGTWVFPPSYDEGLRAGLSDVRFAVLAEGERRLFQETLKLQKNSEQLQRDLTDAQNKISELTRAIEQNKDKPQGAS